MTVNSANSVKPDLGALELLRLESLPEVKWHHGDDLCDCTFQRIGSWTNPYLCKTLTVRMCCIWKEISKDYPDLVQEVDGYFDSTANEFIPKVFPWDSPDIEMPRDIWYRQLQAETGLPLDVIRETYRMEQPPQAVPRPDLNLNPPPTLPPGQPGPLTLTYATLAEEYTKAQRFIDQAKVDVIKFTGIKEYLAGLIELSLSREGEDSNGRD